jgi:hypothetical protein
MEVELFYENGRTESHDEANTPFRNLRKLLKRVDPDSRKIRIAFTFALPLAMQNYIKVTKFIGQTKVPVYLSRHSVFLCNMSTH